jgi:hypothetical protein
MKKTLLAGMAVLSLLSASAHAGNLCMKSETAFG